MADWLDNISGWFGTKKESSTSITTATQINTEKDLEQYFENMGKQGGMSRREKRVYTKRLKEDEKFS